MDNLPSRFTFPLEWEIPDQLTPRYATNVVVQHGEHEFLLSFFDIQKPILVGSQEDIKNQLSRIDKVIAKCVGQIYIAADEFPKIISVLQQQYDDYQKEKIK